MFGRTNNLRGISHRKSRVLMGEIKSVLLISGFLSEYSNGAFLILWPSERMGMEVVLELLLRPQILYGVSYYTLARSYTHVHPTWCMDSSWEWSSFIICATLAVQTGQSWCSLTETAIKLRLYGRNSFCFPCVQHRRHLSVSEVIFHFNQNHFKIHSNSSV